jgi:hypothetical protein
MRRDPGAFFDRLANGKTALTKADMPVWLQDRFDQWTQAAGVTNGQLTRDQFVQAMQSQGGGFGGGNRGDGGQGNGNGPPDTSSWADNAFRRLDQNGDGVLNNDEMPEELRAERDKWDTDKNGLIDLNEFKAYFQARMQQWQQDRNAGNNGPPPLFVPGVDPEPAEPEVKKAIAYRVGKLPKELPDWFQQLDTDGDAQIGLYEWKASGRPLDEFMKMDRNGDGFLTVQEVLYRAGSALLHGQSEERQRRRGQWPGRPLRWRTAGRRSEPHQLLQRPRPQRRRPQRQPIPQPRRWQWRRGPG